MIGKAGDTVLEINWITSPFRAEKFAAVWQPAAEAVMDHGATGWSFLRSTDDPQHFVQLALFARKIDFELKQRNFQEEAQNRNNELRKEVLDKVNTAIETKWERWKRAEFCQEILLMSASEQPAPSHCSRNSSGAVGQAQSECG